MVNKKNIIDDNKFYQWKSKDTYEIIDQLFPCEASKRVAFALLFAGKIMGSPEVIGDGHQNIVSKIIKFADEYSRGM